MPTIVNVIRHFPKMLYQAISNRREDERSPILGPVNASWKNWYGEVVTISCEGVNVSPKGAAIVSPEPRARSASAYLCSSKHGLETFGVARYCNKLAGGGYQIGFRFAEEPKSRKPA